MSGEVKIPHKGKARAWARARANTVHRIASLECVLEYFEEIS